MRILFDHRAPQGIARALAGHTVITAYAQGWDELNNGLLLDPAEESLAAAAKWSRVRLHLERICAAINAASPGSFTEVGIPFD